MSDSKRSGRFLSYGMPAFAILTVIYLALDFFLPANPRTIHLYNLTAGNYHVLNFLMALPSLFLWFVAFLSYSMLKSYAEVIKRTKEGGGFNRLAQGTAWLAWSPPVTTISALILTAIAYEHPGFRPAATIIVNYISLIMPLVAFIIINRAASGLFNQAKLHYDLFSNRILAMFFVAIGVADCFLTFRNLSLTSLSASNNPYFLPIWMVILTLTIPFLYAWFVGILACYEINIYSNRVKGVFYRKALRLVTAGLIIVIASFIAQQYLRSVLPRTAALELDFRIVLLMIFRVCATVGFGLIALGALRLKRIEEV